MATKLTDTNQASATMESKGSSRMNMSRLTMVLALLTIVGIVDFLLNVAVLHFLRFDANPMLEPMSNCAVGPYGFLLTAADTGSGLARVVRGCLKSRKSCTEPCSLKMSDFRGHTTDTLGRPRDTHRYSVHLSA
jgi:hypothetical protein